MRVQDITKQARRYAKAMKAPLIFSSASHSINVQKLFKILLSRVFDLKVSIVCSCSCSPQLLSV